ncbi:MAG: polysaccharide biosynthesis tyrosine autokinase, partial [Cyanobacteria bacterium J06597_1]
GTIEAMELTTEEGDPISYTEFATNLETESLLGTDVLAVAFSSPDAELSAQVVNSLMDVYLDSNIRANQRAAEEARQFIEAQLPRTEATVAEAEEALWAFKTENGIVDLTGEANSTVVELSEMRNQISQLRVELAATVRQTESLQSELGLSYENALAAVELAQSPGVNEAIAQLQQAQSHLATERSRFREGHPAIKHLENEVDQLQGVLTQRVNETQSVDELTHSGTLQLSELQVGLIGDFIRAELQRQSLLSQIEALNVTLEDRTARANLLPDLQKSERELERRLMAANATYETLLSRLRELQAAENQAVGNARVISQAIPPIYPIGSRGKLLVAAATIASGILSIVTAFALDLLDPSVKSTRDVRKLFPFHTVAQIPNLSAASPSLQRKLLLPSRRPSAVQSTKQHVARAVFNALQTNLNYSSQHSRPPQIITVSSARPQEGKTTVATNLATTMALQSYRTLLIDADLYRPKQHTIWDIERRHGLQGLLRGVSTVSQAIHPVRANLDVMSIGASGSHPSPSIDYRKLRTILSILRRQYDRIIVDSPPLLGAADAAIQADIADGLLMVARPSLLDVSGARMVNDLLTRSGISVLGLVINNPNDEGEGDYPYYYANHQTQIDIKPLQAPSKMSML